MLESDTLHVGAGHGTDEVQRVGDAQRECGADDRLDTAVLSAIAARAARIFPHLRDVRVTRAWSALRVMSPDTFPIYAQSRTHTSAFGVTCHSGVTLAAVHAQSTCY